LGIAVKPVMPVMIDRHEPLAGTATYDEGRDPSGRGPHGEISSV